MSNKLTIEVNFEKGVDMEEGLNKAIDELSSVLKKKGLMNMELKGVGDDLRPLYNVNIEINL